MPTNWRKRSARAERDIATSCASASTLQRHSGAPCNRRSAAPIEPEHGYTVIDAVKRVAARVEATPAQVALAWLLARPGVTTAIVGARRPEQLQDNLGALALALSDQDVAQLDAASSLPTCYPAWVQAMTNTHRTGFLERQHDAAR